jgi:hypothetical protein
MRFALLLALLFLARISFAEANATNAAPTAPAPISVPPRPATASGNGKPASSAKVVSHSQATAIELQKAVDQLTQSNRDLLDLLKKQQAVLEDIQFDRRQQSRHIDSLEERLAESRLQNAQLQSKVANLEADAAVRPLAPPATGPATPTVPPASTHTPPVQSVPAPVATTPPPPATYLPLPESEGAPGTKSWHRLFTLKGSDGRQSDLFHIQGRTWRVLWHNQDPPGKTYQNTSALFINAFPKDDTIPQKVCSKLGSGGDSAELDGPGNYYLKIEASGGSWELAVEDFR